MKYSTGIGTRTKHSTAMEWDEYERRKRSGRSRVRYSTGRNAILLHFTGAIMDNQAEDELEGPQGAGAVERPGDDAKSEKQPKKPSQFKSMKAQY